MTTDPQVTSRGPVVGPGSLVELDFGVEHAVTLEHAAVPTISFGLRAAGPPGLEIRSLLLDVQIQIAARRRRYGEAEKEQLLEVFGEESRWATTLRTLLWARLTRVVPGFTGETIVELHMPCTYDFEVTSAKYLHALDDGEIPLEFLFSGTAFYTAPTGLLQTSRISWDHEAEYRLPVRVWRETMDRYFADSAWLRLSRDAFERLYAYRSRKVLPTWEATVDSLLAGDEDEDG
jgi:uncharacterized protein DUF6084